MFFLLLRGFCLQPRFFFSLRVRQTRTSRLTVAICPEWQWYWPTKTELRRTQYTCAVRGYRGSGTRHGAGVGPIPTVLATGCDQDVRVRSFNCQIFKFEFLIPTNRFPVVM